MAKSENKRRTKGEGSLEFNEKKKKWVARITAHRADGSSFRKTFEGKTQKEAKSKRDEWLRHHKEESERIRSNEAFGKYVNEWMENVGRNGIKAQTYKRNVRTIRTYVVPYLGELLRYQICGLTPPTEFMLKSVHMTSTAGFAPAAKHGTASKQHKKAVTAIVKNLFIKRSSDSQNAFCL